MPKEIVIFPTPSPSMPEVRQEPRDPEDITNNKWWEADQLDLYTMGDVFRPHHKVMIRYRKHSEKCDIRICFFAKKNLGGQERFLSLDNMKNIGIGKVAELIKNDKRWNDQRSYFNTVMIDYYEGYEDNIKIIEQLPFYRKELSF